MKHGRASLMALALIAMPAAAQVRPQSGSGDPRMQQVTYSPDQVVELDVGVGYQLTVELASDEHVESVAVGDSSAWQVVANKRGDYLFVKALAAGVPTNMIVVTDARRYAFDLRAGGGGTDAYFVKFNYPESNAGQAVAAAPPPTQGDAEPVSVRYFMSGTKLLRPDAIAEDGIHTYLTFAANQPLPAIFAIDRLGRESLVNGAMRDGQFVIDGIEHELIFRLHKQEARARRVVEKARTG